MSDGVDYEDTRPAVLWRRRQDVIPRLPLRLVLHSFWLFVFRKAVRFVFTTSTLISNARVAYSISRTKSGLYRFGRPSLELAVPPCQSCAYQFPSLSVQVTREHGWVYSVKHLFDCSWPWVKTCSVLLVLSTLHYKSARRRHCAISNRYLRLFNQHTRGFEVFLFLHLGLQRIRTARA